MPRVGDVDYPYTPEGIAKAKADAAVKGVKVEYQDGGEAKYGDNTKLKEKGGIATGGKGGVDDIPALLTEGEAVLNKDQIAAVGAIAGMESGEEVLAEAEVPGFEAPEEMEDGGKVKESWVNKYDEGGIALLYDDLEEIRERRILEEELQQLKKDKEAKKEKKKANKKIQKKESYKDGGKVESLFNFPTTKSRE